MRDPNRIDEILSLVESYWKQFPDQRLGQVIVNLMKYSGAEIIAPSVFYFDDEKLLELIECQEKTKKE